MSYKLTKGRPKRQISESIDQIIVVKFEILRRVAPYHFTKKGIIEYPKKL
jgi:hypothetical protein